MKYIDLPYSNQKTSDKDIIIQCHDNVMGIVDTIFDTIAEAKKAHPKIHFWQSRPRHFNANYKICVEYDHLVDINHHSKAMYLLATHFGDKVCQKVCKMNSDRTARLFHCDEKLNKFARILTSEMYYQMKNGKTGIIETSREKLDIYKS